MADFPAELSTGMVHGRFIVAVIDSEDEGQEPDVVPAQGKVAFKASVGYIPVPVATGGPVTVMKGPIMGVLDDDGYLCTPHPTTGDPMYRGVRLISTDDPDMAVTDWTWNADYRLEAVNGNSMQIPAHSFALPSGAEVDLTTLVKVPSSPGYGLPQAEAAVLRAEAIAQSIRDDADNGMFNGEAATVEIGTVTSGTTAEVVNVGDEQHAILNITLEKGDKGDPGTGLPNAGAALQVMRMDSDGIAAEWVTPSKSIVGLSNVDNTSDMDKPVSTMQRLALDEKLDAVNLPDEVDGVNKNLIEDPASQTSAALSAEFVQRGSNLISAGLGAADTLPDGYDVGATGTVVALGRDAMGSMLGAKKSIAIGTGAQANGLYTRDNVAIGEDALNYVSAASADYVSDVSGTRNVAVGGNAGRFTAQGVAHTMIGRNAGQNMVGGTGLVAIGNGAHASRCPVGISGEIEMWAPANPVGTNAYNVTAVGAWSASRNTAGDCTAIGSYALAGNTRSNANVAIGANAMRRVDETTWLDGTSYLLKETSGTYVHEQNVLSLSFPAHGASVDDILDFRLLDGGSKTFGTDAVFAKVVSVPDVDTVIVDHPTLKSSSGLALLVGVSLQGVIPARSNDNTAVGAASFAWLDGGGANTAVGKDSGLNVKTGNYNVAVGTSALYSEVGAASNDNVAIGHQALKANNGSIGNVAVGRLAGQTVANGTVNTLIGYRAGDSAPPGIKDASALGAYTKTLHDSVVVLGRGSESTAPLQATIGTRHFEIRGSAQPATPSNAARIWYDSVAGALKCITPSGTVTTLAP